MKKNKKKNFFPFSRPYVFVSMSVDLFHHGHLNILLKAKKYGNVIVGLMTDKGIKSYKKRKPLIEFSDRKKILKHLDCVDFIIPVNNINFAKLAQKYKFDYAAHGTDWRNGVQAQARKNLIKVMKKWNGKVIEFAYTKKISSTKIKRSIGKTLTENTGSGYFTKRKTV